MDDILIDFMFFSQKKGFDIPCKLPKYETMYEK